MSDVRDETRICDDLGPGGTCRAHAAIGVEVLHAPRTVSAEVNPELDLDGALAELVACRTEIARMRRHFDAVVMHKEPRAGCRLCDDRRN